ncbi:MAG TPA: GspH/FimT family pseudopilin [Burkholderiaceae bacterium]
MHRRARGFSLLELLIVMAIVGLTLGMVSLSASQSAQKDLQNDAQRIALLLQMARDEAIVRDRPVAFEADENHYGFLVKNDKDWEAISDDDLMRSREFKRAPVTLLMTPQPDSSQNNGMLRIVFGREPVDKPFVLKLAQGDDAVSIQADGIGHFTVQ